MESKTVYKNPWFKVTQEGQYHFIDESSNNGAIAIVRMNDMYMMVEALRPANQGIFLETPRGYSEPGETPCKTALREAEEELGIVIKRVEEHYLGKMHPNTSILRSSIPIYLLDVKEYKGSVGGYCDQEISRLRFLKKSRIDELIRSGDITCSMTISAFYMLSLLDKS